MKKFSECDNLIINDIPFIHFMSENYIDEEFYEKLYNEFPSKEYFGNKASYGEKYLCSTRKTPKLFNEFMESSEVWKDFISFLNSDEFTNDILDIFNLKSLIKNFKCGYSNKLTSNTLIKKIFCKSIKTDFEFSELYNDSYVPPHLDSRRKFITILFYFPDYDWNEEYGGNTIFYKLAKNNLKNYINYYLKEPNYSFKSDKELENFYDDMQVLLRIPFQKGLMAGFMRNKKSFHEVLPLNLPEGKSRKVFIMNLQYDED